MSRRSTPERLAAARRAAILARLVSAGVLPDRAEAAIRRWEDAQGDRVRDAAYWDEAFVAITQRRGS